MKNPGLARSRGRSNRKRPEATKLNEMLHQMSRAEVAKKCGVTHATVVGWICRFKLVEHRMFSNQINQALFASETDAFCLAHARQPCGSVTPGPLSYWQQQGVYMMGAEQ